MSNINSISIFFPCYNDKGTIKKLIDDATETVHNLNINDYEIIVTDDGSIDGARELLASLQETNPRLKVVFHEHNQGYGAALKSGFAQAAEPEVDLVNGYKIKRQDTFDRIIIGKIYQWAMKVVFLLKIRDVDCDYRLFKKEKLDQITLKSDDGSMCVELSRRLQNAGVVIREVPVHHYSRTYGQSQFFTVRRVSRTLMTLFKLWWELVLLGKAK